MSLKLFAERLVCLIELEGISKRTLAKQANVQRKSLLNWTEGKNYPRYDSLVNLADFFKVKTDFLLGLETCEEKEMSGIRCPIEDIPAQFRGKLYCYMKEESLTKYALAKKLGMGQTTLERWFSDGAMPDTAVLIKLAAIMEETVDFLLGRE